MPTVAVKLYSFLFKFTVKHRLQSRIGASPDEADPSGVTSRPEDAVAPPTPPSPMASPPRTSTWTILAPPSLSAFSSPRRRYPAPILNLGLGRIAKLCDVVVVAVGYRLAPENRYPAAFEDGVRALHWVGKQANLADWSRSQWKVGRDTMNDNFGASMVEPWLAAHGDPSRCVLLGVSCGANIADYVARRSVEAGKLLDPVKVVAQILMYPFFIGSVPTKSEIKLANSYFYDKAMCLLAWKLFLPEEEVNLDHPAANPLIPGRGPPLKCMPPTLTVVAEHDWMRDRAIAYSEELRKVNVDAPLLDYKDAVHEFATLDVLLKTPQAQACAEDIAIWVKKYISLRGHEFSY
ncbi:putative carboxylesterase 16 [Vitis vinifera]|uniref:Putative carboxylesterase 16 n=1 Tax=Vitis vinifera TaxID=29760 RepID=A0A438JRW5_VITVI|nr:putative carboxylesterase 16 [Vitis vinifera]